MFPDLEIMILAENPHYAFFPNFKFKLIFNNLSTMHIHAAR